MAVHEYIIAYPSPQVDQPRQSAVGLLKSAGVLLTATLVALIAYRSSLLWYGQLTHI